MPNTQIPEASTKGFAKATLYDLHRPSYPLDVVDALLKATHIDDLKGAKIIDLAAGTGKFTELLANRVEGYQITAIEPNDDMRAELERKTKGEDGWGNVVVLKGQAGDMPVESGAFDVVFVAQAWHWFANEESLDEIYRVLIPGGCMGMIWNAEDYNSPKSWEPSTQWESKLKDIVWATGNDNPRLRHEQWKQVFERQLESNPLSIQTANPRFSLPIGEGSYKWTHWLSEEEISKRFFTLSHMAVLEGEALEATKKQVSEALKGPDVERNQEGKVALHGRTTTAWTTAIPGAPLKSGG